MAAPLTAALKRLGLDATLRMVELVRRWPDIVGKRMAENTWLEAIREGVLVVGTEHPAWKQEIHFRQAEILARARALVGDAAPRSLSTVIKPRPFPKEPEKLEIRPEASAFGSEVVRPVEDEVLREAIRRAAAANAEARFRGRLR